MQVRLTSGFVTSLVRTPGIYLSRTLTLTRMMSVHSDATNPKVRRICVASTLRSAHLWCIVYIIS